MLLFGAATECPRSSPACHGSVRCRPDFGSSPQSATSHFPQANSNSPPSPTIKSGNGTLTSPVTSLTFDFNSNLAVEMSPPFKTPRRGLLDSLDAKRDLPLSAMDVDPDSAEQLAGEAEAEGLGDDADDGENHAGDDAMDVDDGSPLGRLKPTSTLYQTKLSFSHAHIPAPPGSDAMYDVERPAGSKRRISSLNHSLTPKVPGRNPFGRELTSHWSQRRLTSFVNESNKSKAPTPVFPSRQDQPVAMTPSCPKRDCALLPADTPTMARPPSVVNGNPSPSAPDDKDNDPSPSDAAAGHHGTSPSGAAPPSKFRRTQSMNSNVFSSQHRCQPPIRHCNSLPTLPTDYPEAGTVLPSIETGKDALKRISPSTLVDLLDGQYKEKYDECYVIDCRFPYEYAGGHIPTAVNVNTMDALEKMFVTKPMTENRVLLVFHCEFSSQRAPRMALHLRNQDRRMNMHNYPHLHYPEMYILKGGYKDFFAEYKERCSPPGYVEMAHENFKAECKASMSLYKSSFKRSKSYTTEGPPGGYVAFRRSASFTVGSTTTSSESEGKSDVF